jgi:hypothetical protein
MNTQEIMAELDEHKQEIPENLYIQLANLLKEKHNNTVDESSEDDENNIAVCLKITYIESRAEVFKKYLDGLQFDGWYVLVKEKDIDEYDDDLSTIHHIITHNMFDNLPNAAYEEFIEKEGGITRGYERMKIYLKDDYESFMKRFNRFSKLQKNHSIAYHIIDHHIFEYQYEDDIPSEDNENVIELKALLKILQEMHNCC